MLKLYRGLVDILTTRSEGLNDAFSKHIREFNDGDTSSNNFGVTGFWNLLLEITYILFVKLFSATGIVLTFGLAVIFFPLHAIMTMVANILNHRAEGYVFEDVTEKKNGNTQEKV